VKIQVALDLVDILKAISLSRGLCKAGVEILEAGTPLIKAFGIPSISAIKSSCPTAEVVADLKTVDTGALEVEIAHLAGADVVTALGLASDETLVEFVAKSRELGIKSAIDLMGVSSCYDYAVGLLERGIRPDIFILHVGIDVQVKRGVNFDLLLSEARRVKELGVGVALAGGIGPTEISKIRDCDIDVVIVGRAITRSEDPIKTYVSMRETLRKVCERS